MKINKALARDVASGNDDAFDAFFHEYFPRLFRFTLAEPVPGLKDKLPDRITQAAARVLMKNRWFSRNILAARWFLHQQVPPLPPHVEIH